VSVKKLMEKKYLKKRKGKNHHITTVNEIFFLQIYVNFLYVSLSLSLSHTQFLQFHSMMMLMMMIVKRANNIHKVDFLFSYVFLLLLIHIIYPKMPQLHVLTYSLTLSFISSFVQQAVQLLHEMLYTTQKKN
jgi:hypothetical protein